MRSLALSVAMLLSTLVFSPPAFAGGLARVAETPRAVYFAASKRDVDVRRNEAFLKQLDALFGPAPATWRVAYYRHASVEAVQAKVGLPASGVTDLVASRIDTVQPYHPHELVHAAMGRVGVPPVLFSEGLAVALAGEGVWYGRSIDDIGRAFVAINGDLRSVLLDFGAEHPVRDYALAGSFVAYLLDAYGIEAMLDFLRGCAADPGRCDRALEASYGRAFNVLAAEWARSLDETGGRVSRRWYDPTTWPSSLRPARRAGTASATALRLP